MVSKCKLYKVKYKNVPTSYPFVKYVVSGATLGAKHLKVDKTQSCLQATQPLRREKCTN